MLGIFFDIIVLGIMVFFVDREEASDIFNLAMTAVMMMISNFVIALLLVPKIGPVALLPMMAVGLLAIRWRFTLTWTKTAIVLVGLYTAKFAFMLAFSAMMNTIARS
jgi:hypothetical protein